MHLGGKKVLLVEDNKVNILLASKFLDKWGVTYDISENGQEAIDKVKVNDYDLVLMDLQMPVMDGFEATRCIRLMTEEKKNIPILALSASAMLDVQKEVLKQVWMGLLRNHLTRMI